MTEARDIEKKLQKSYRETRDINEQKAVDAIKNNSKYFSSYAGKFSYKVMTGIDPLMSTENAHAKCNELRKMKCSWAGHVNRLKDARYVTTWRP